MLLDLQGRNTVLMPSIATIIPAMDHIDKHLATATIDNVYPLTIKVALMIGKKTLNHYYNKTDHSKAFRIAMGMYFPTLLLFFLIYYTLITSSNISEMQDGRMSGLRGWKKLFIQNLIYYIDPWTQVGQPCKRLNSILKPKYMPCKLSTYIQSHHLL